MNTERDWVRIPVEEYRELVRAKRDAECILAAISKKYLSYEEVDLLVRMYFSQEEGSEDF